MSTDLSKQLQAAYDHATMRQLGKHVEKGADWQRVQEVQQRHDQARQQEAKNYRKTYEARVAKEREALLRKRGQNTLQVKAPVATDRFQKSTLERQAHLNVRNAHQQRLNGISASETKDLKEIADRAGLTRDKRPSQAFDQAQKQATQATRPTHQHKQRL